MDIKLEEKNVILDDVAVSAKFISCKVRKKTALNSNKISNACKTSIAIFKLIDGKRCNIFVCKQNIPHPRYYLSNCLHFCDGRSNFISFFSLCPHLNLIKFYWNWNDSLVRYMQCLPHTHMKSLRVGKKTAQKLWCCSNGKISIEINLLNVPSQPVVLFFFPHDFVTQSFCHVAVMLMHAFHFTSFLLYFALARQRLETE